jgi:hypothetical protein
MSLSSVTQEITATVDVYEQLLHGVSETEFQRTPAPGVWSYAEVFAHIFRSNMLMRPVIEKCANGQAIENKDSLGIPYRLVLFFRRFPPTMKFKVPPKLEHLVEKVNKSQAQELIDQFRKDLPELISMAENASPYQKVKHPRMGLLNAEQWMMFTELHTKHHARQLRRVGKLLANG